jgi:hypothetical protein
LTHCRSSSTEDSRRSRTGGRRGIALLALALLATAPLAAAPLPAAPKVDLSVERRATTRAAASDDLVARVSFRWDRRDDLVSSLRAGMESRITFTVRLFERRPSLLRLRGDRLVAERKTARSAFWDFLDNSFVVETDDGRRSSFSTAEDLLDGFLTLGDLRLAAVPRAPRPGRFYVSARALLEPVRLMPPLTLVELAGQAATATTPWVVREAP